MKRKPIINNRACWSCADDAARLDPESEFLEGFSYRRNYVARCRMKSCEHYNKRLGRAEQPRSTSCPRPAFKNKPKGK